MTKPAKWPMRPAKTLIILGIRPAWSESLLSAWRNAGSLATYLAQSEYSDQSGRMPRLIWVFPGRAGHFVGFVMLRFQYLTEPERLAISTEYTRQADLLDKEPFSPTAVSCMLSRPPVDGEVLFVETPDFIINSTDNWRDNQGWVRNRYGQIKIDVFSVLWKKIGR